MDHLGVLMVSLVNIDSKASLFSVSRFSISPERVLEVNISSSPSLVKIATCIRIRSISISVEHVFANSKCLSNLGFFCRFVNIRPESSTSSPCLNIAGWVILEGFIVSNF